MITDINVCSTFVRPWEMSMLKAEARGWDFPGHSNVRGSEDRAANLRDDALTGMIGQYVGTKFLFGAVALDKFLVNRWHAGQHKFESDGGHDIDCANIDFKTSLRRKESKPLLEYNLVVRPEELYAGWVYILIIVDMFKQDNASAHIIGWATDAMFPPPATSGIFKGAHVLPARELNPVMPIRWDYFTRGPVQ